MVDSNAMDAEDMDKDPEHNICGAAHNPPGASCTAAGGPADLGSCKQWFWDLWAKNQAPVSSYSPLQMCKHILV